MRANPDALFKLLNTLFKSIGLNLWTWATIVEVNGMAYDTRKVAAFGVMGFLIALMIMTGISSYLTSYLTLLPPPAATPPTATAPPVTGVSNMGTLVLILTDAPPRTLKYLYIKVDEVRLHMKGNETSEGGWTENFTVTPTVYNVTALKTAPATLAINPVPAGNYTTIWLHIVEANATFAENPSSNETLKVVAQGWLKIQVSFEVDPGDTYVVVLDFDMAQTHVSAAKVLTPVIRPKQVIGP